MIQPVQIGKFLAGPGQPCLVIAEAGVNHNGSIDLAHRLVDAAFECGADAVKFQSFVTEELVTPLAGKAGYQVQTTGSADKQFNMLKALELDAAQQEALKKHCEEKGILFLSTPYDLVSVDLLDRLDVAAYKIASTDTTNLPFLAAVAHKNRPVLLSTGMSTLAEVEDALHALTGNGLAGKVVILHCTSEYPAPVDEVNLRAMRTLEVAFQAPVGFSDHTAGIGASPWAAALGACVIEKHFTLDRTLSGPDHRASIEPGELKQLVTTLKQVQAALGDGIKRPMPSELPNKPHMQKSLTVRRDIAAGAVIGAEDLTCKRPGSGLPPSWMDKVIGKRAARAMGRDTLVTLDCVDWQ